MKIDTHENIGAALRAEREMDRLALEREAEDYSYDTEPHGMVILKGGWRAYVTHYAGEFTCDVRDLPLERTPNHFTGEHRDEVAR